MGRPKILDGQAVERRPDQGNPGLHEDEVEIGTLPDRDPYAQVVEHDDEHHAIKKPEDYPIATLSLQHAAPVAHAERQRRRSLVELVARETRIDGLRLRAKLCADEAAVENDRR